MAFKFNWDESRGVWITLNKGWLLASTSIGKYRWINARHLAHGGGSSAYAVNAKNDIRGVRCEIAVGQFLNLFVGFGGYVEGKTGIDVGDMVESRSAEHPGRKLIVKPGDKDLPTVCVLCHREKEGKFLLAGWANAAEAKRKYPAIRKPSLKDPTKLTDLMHLVPLNELRDMHELRKLVDIERTRKAWSSQFIEVYPMAFGEESIHAETIRTDEGFPCSPWMKDAQVQA